MQLLRLTTPNFHPSNEDLSLGTPELRCVWGLVRSGWHSHFLLNISLSLLSSHDDFRDAVFGQELFMRRPAGKELFDAAVGKGSLNGEGLCELHLNVVGWGEMESAIDRLLAFGTGMAEGKHLAAGVHGCVQMRDYGSNQGLGQVVERRPQQDDVKGAPRQVERLLKISFDIPGGFSVFIHAGCPVGVAGVANQVGKEDALAKAGEVIDVCRRGVAYVDDAQAGLRLKALAQDGPALGMAGHTRPSEPG